MTTTDHDFAILILQPAALIPENEADRERILHDLAAELGDAGETERAEVTNLSAHGTGEIIRFPGITQAACERSRRGRRGRRVPPGFFCCLASEPS